MEEKQQNPGPFTKEHIDKLTFKVSSLGQKERGVVRKALYDLKYRKGGKFSKAQLHIELMKLRKLHDISDIDRRNIEKTFFG